MEAVTYTLKDVCDKTGYKPSVIRYYEKEFKLNIPRDDKGRRYFTENDLNKLLFIRELQDQGYTNGQIKRMINEHSNEVISEVAATYNLDDAGTDVNELIPANTNVIKYIDKKLEEINESLSELNQNVTGKERDILITENMRLKMEIKQKSYEVLELKEKLRYEKESKRGLLSLFSKKNK